MYVQYVKTSEKNHDSTGKKKYIYFRIILFKSRFAFSLLYLFGYVCNDRLRPRLEDEFPADDRTNRVFRPEMKDDPLKF
jgi:hypothetical protein